MAQPPGDLPLAEQTARRLILAGIQPDDPGLLAIRAWNASAYQRTNEADRNRSALVPRG